MRCEEEFLGRVEVLGTMAAPPNGGASSPPDENKRSNGDFLGKLEEAEARDEETLKENVRRSRASSWTGWEAELGPPGQTPAAETLISTSFDFGSSMSISSISCSRTPPSTAAFIGLPLQVIHNNVHQMSRK